MENNTYKKSVVRTRPHQFRENIRVWLKPAIFLTLFLFVFSLFVIPMGLSNALNTMMNTAYKLLIDTTLYLSLIHI